MMAISSSVNSYGGAAKAGMPPRMPASADAALHASVGNYGEQVTPFDGVCTAAGASFPMRYAVNAALDSRKPTLVNAVIDPAAGSESGRIGNLNPQSALRKKQA